jgi:hypothetical protein
MERNGAHVGKDKPVGGEERIGKVARQGWLDKGGEGGGKGGAGRGGRDEVEAETSGEGQGESSKAGRGEKREDDKHACTRPSPFSPLLPPSLPPALAPRPKAGLVPFSLPFLPGAPFHPSTPTVGQWSEGQSETRSEGSALQCP